MCFFVIQWYCRYRLSLIWLTLESFLRRTENVKATTTCHAHTTTWHARAPAMYTYQRACVSTCNVHTPVWHAWAPATVPRTQTPGSYKHTVRQSCFKDWRISLLCQFPSLLAALARLPTLATSDRESVNNSHNITGVLLSQNASTFHLWYC